VQAGDEISLALYVVGLGRNVVVVMRCLLVRSSPGRRTRGNRLPAQDGGSRWAALCRPSRPSCVVSHQTLEPNRPTRPA